MADHSGSLGFFAGEALAKTAQRHPQKIAIIAKEGELTFATLERQVRALAAHLQGAGIRQGDRVGVFLPNSAAIPLSYFATQSIGVITVILDARLKGKELSGVLQDADLKLLVVDIHLSAEVQKARAGSSPLPMWVVHGDGDQSFESKLTALSNRSSPPTLNANDDALILYTSGTTGEPKGVVLSYQNLAQYPRVMTEMRITGLATVRGCVLPMSHIVGPIVCNELVDKAFTLVIFDQLNPITLLEGIQKHRVTVFEGVPVVFQLLLGVRHLTDFDTRSVKIVAMMGTTVPVPLLRAFKAAQPHITVIQGYGLTESSPMITVVEPEQATAKLGSIGRAVPGVEIKIVDEEGKEVPVGDAGEIITRGPHIMKGYFRNQAATTARIHDGWLYTGDVGKCDDDGYYYHLGRRDDMIITGGLNVYPAEIENMIYGFAAVQEAIVFGIPDEKRGQALGAAVVPRAGQTISERELMTYLRGNLANFKVPQKIVIRDSLPRTSSGKVIRDAETLLAG